jgi:hypothetical protein
MPERSYVEVDGKKIPLKTEAERSGSSASRPQPKSSSNGNGSMNVSLPSNSAPRQVLLALTVGLLVFLAAGGKIEKVIAKARGEEPPADDKQFTAATIFAWGALFVGLMVLADFPTTGSLAVAFAYLIAFSIFIEFGPEAFNNVSEMTKGFS